MPLTATLPQRRQFASLSPHGFHRVVYYEWGDPANARVVVCVHGIGRNGRDFDVLGEALAPTHRVLAVDMPGRGASDWLADPHDYVFPTYLTVLTALIARSGAETVDWVGTSMGGLLGITMAALPQSPLARLIVNDVGPAIEAVALERIASYFGMDPTFPDYPAVAGYIRAISAPFGPLTDEQWEHVVRTNVRQRADGTWGLGYDPGIAVPFRAAPAPANLWPLWDAIRCPTLVLRGAQSDLLSAATAAEMSARGPRPSVVEFAGVGHAPTLLAPEQIEPVLRFCVIDSGSANQARASAAACARWQRLAVAAVAALTLLEFLWEMWLAPVRPGGSWLALKALPLALAWPGLARGARRARQRMTLLLLPYAGEGLVRGISESGRHSLVAWMAAALAGIAFIALLQSFRAERRARATRANDQSG